MLRRLVLVLMLLTRASAVALVAPRLPRGAPAVVESCCARARPSAAEAQKKQQQKKGGGGKGGGGGLPGLTAR